MVQRLAGCLTRRRRCRVRTRSIERIQNDRKFVLHRTVFYPGNRCTTILWDGTACVRRAVFASDNLVWYIVLRYHRRARQLLEQSGWLVGSVHSDCRLMEHFDLFLEAGPKLTFEPGRASNLKFPARVETSRCGVSTHVHLLAFCFSQRLLRVFCSNSSFAWYTHCTAPLKYTPDKRALLKYMSKNGVVFEYTFCNCALHEYLSRRLPERNVS